MSQNLISAELTEKDQTAALAAIQQIQSLPFHALRPINTAISKLNELVDCVAQHATLLTNDQILQA